MTTSNLTLPPLPTTSQVFKCESFAYNASSDVIQAEQMADAQLKALVQEWEAMLDSLKARVEDRVSEELNPMVYPQVGFGFGFARLAARATRRRVLLMLTCFEVYGPR